ncbi:tetratricopeptide repeat-containing sensor histidine kinase [Chitinophaga rhizophila]|uniref:histidine kinase n=1 Tax=Chitinophaga rhizophila TaxID=2866212 RepID=A0ABS7G8X9_9BACT|nr:sensor histidine kinase [Chitinophaga rhizophila]MBW8683851.1 sensor histidine kinase [Chitinophaga rhizophila]
MIRIYTLIALIVAMSVRCEAQVSLNQQRYYDSLTAILNSPGADSLKARAHYALTIYWVPRDTTKAKQCIEEGRKLSKGSAFLQGIAYANEGYLYYGSDIDRSEAAFKKADSLLTPYDNRDACQIRANIWINCAVIQQRKDDDRGYIDLVLNKAIPLASRAGDSVIMASQYVGVSVAFMNIEQYDKAEVYLNDAIRIYKAIHAPAHRLVAAYNRAGENYILLKKYEAAKKTVDEVKPLLAPFPESELYAGHYMVEGLYYHHRQQYTDAIRCFDKGMAAAKGPNKVFAIQELQFYKVKSLLAAKIYAPAKDILLQLMSDEDIISMNSSRLEIYEGLAESYAGIGEMKHAYEWLKKSRHLSDSLHASDVENDINALEMKYQRAESQKQIIALKGKTAQAALAAKNSRLYSWLFAITSLFLLVVASFALLYYRSNKKLLVQKELNHQQQLNEIEQEQRLKFGQAVLQGEERERHRLARDLHDGLGGMLAAVKLNLSAQLSGNGQEGMEMRKVISQVDSSVTELRRIAHNMMPVNLLKFGLETALRDMCESLMTDKLSIDFQAYGVGNLSEEQQIHIYRIVQEMLSNAIKHADATHIILQCSQDGDTFLITLEDDGKGFDTTISSKGIGLTNLRNRVGFLNGSIEITSVINEGTIINIELNVG